MNDFQHKVQQELTKAIANHQEYHFVPPFAINANITRHREVYNGQSIYHNTEAFEVECAPSDAAALVKTLYLADLPLRQFGTFIPFSIIREDPELLIQKIADNNHLKTIMTTLYLNVWHTSVMHDSIEENTTTQQALMNQTELCIASIERTYNTDIAGQWAIIVPITEQNHVRNYVNNVLIPATTVLKSYETSKSINSNYNNGLSISRFKTALNNSESQIITILRNKTKFLTTADNLPYLRSIPSSRNRNTQPVTVNFDSSPQRNTQAKTNAWNNSNESTSVVSLNTVTTNPYTHQRAGGTSSNSTINTTSSDKTTISQLRRMAEQQKANTINTTTNNPSDNATNKQLRADMDTMMQAMTSLTSQFTNFIQQCNVTVSPTATKATNLKHHSNNTEPTNTTDGQTKTNTDLHMDQDNDKKPPANNTPVNMTILITTDTDSNGNNNTTDTNANAARHSNIHSTTQEKSKQKPPPNPLPYLSKILNRLTSSPKKLEQMKTPITAILRSQTSSLAAALSYKIPPQQIPAEPRHTRTHCQTLVTQSNNNQETQRPKCSPLTPPPTRRFTKHAQNHFSTSLDSIANSDIDTDSDDDVASTKISINTNWNTTAAHNTLLPHQHKPYGKQYNGYGQPRNDYLKQ